MLAVAAAAVTERQCRSRQMEDWKAFGLKETALGDVKEPAEVESRHLELVAEDIFHLRNQFSFRFTDELRESSAPCACGFPGETTLQEWGTGILHSWPPSSSILSALQHDKGRQEYVLSSESYTQKFLENKRKPSLSSFMLGKGKSGWFSLDSIEFNRITKQTFC